MPPRRRDRRRRQRPSRRTGAALHAACSAGETVPPPMAHRASLGADGAGRTVCASDNVIREHHGAIPLHPSSSDSAWLPPRLSKCAQAAYDEDNLTSGERDPARLAVLYDAHWKSAGCSGTKICRTSYASPQVRGWGVELILSKSIAPAFSPPSALSSMPRLAGRAAPAAPSTRPPLGRFGSPRRAQQSRRSRRLVPSPAHARRGEITKQPLTQTESHAAYSCRYDLRGGPRPPPPPPHGANFMRCRAFCPILSPQSAPSKRSLRRHARCFWCDEPQRHAGRIPPHVRHRFRDKTLRNNLARYALTVSSRTRLRCQTVIYPPGKYLYIMCTLLQEALVKAWSMGGASA